MVMTKIWVVLHIKKADTSLPGALRVSQPISLITIRHQGTSTPQASSVIARAITPTRPAARQRASGRVLACHASACSIIESSIDPSINQSVVVVVVTLTRPMSMSFRSCGRTTTTSEAAGLHCTLQAIRHSTRHTPVCLDVLCVFPPVDKHGSRLNRSISRLNRSIRASLFCPG